MSVLLCVCATKCACVGGRVWMEEVREAHT